MLGCFAKALASLTASVILKINLDILIPFIFNEFESNHRDNISQEVGVRYLVISVLYPQRFPVWLFVGLTVLMVWVTGAGRIRHSAGVIQGGHSIIHPVLISSTGSLHLRIYLAAETCILVIAHPNLRRHLEQKRLSQRLHRPVRFCMQEDIFICLSVIFIMTC